MNSLSDLNLFLVGAPKCGTTAMFNFLGEHPQVFFPVAKELHFFGLDLDLKPPSANFSTNPRSAEETARYLRFFDDVTEQPVRGESSVFYLFSRTAAAEIASHCPDARILIMLRNPVDVICSLHSQYLYDGNESEEDLELALSLAADRLQDRRIPTGSHFPAGLQYLEVVDFCPQVKRYLVEFGRERVHVTLLEEFAENSIAEYERVIEFLGIQTGMAPKFRVVNRNKLVRSRILRDLLKSPPGLLRAAARILPEGARIRARNRLVSLNRVESVRSPITVHLAEQLKSEITPAVDELSALLELDLRRVWGIQD